MKKWVGIGIVVLLCIIAFAVYYSVSSGTRVDAVKAAKGEIKKYLEDSADVKSKEEQTVYCEGLGKVTGINFEVGDLIKKGDTMLTLEKADLELQLRDANAKVKAAREQIRGAELANYADKIEAANALSEQAKVAYDAALREYENAKLLFEAGSLSREDLNKTEDICKTAKTSMDSAKAQLADIKRGTPGYLKNTYISQLEQALVARDSLLRSLQKQEVKAPINGVVLEKYAEINSPMVAGTAVFLVANMNKLELESDILADDSSDVSIGNEVEISGDSLGDRVLKGKVVKIAPSAKTITSTLGVNQKRVPVTIEVIDSKEGLKPGYTVDIKIITQNKKEVLIVPESAVFDYQGTSCVLAVENGKAVIRRIKTGIENDKFIEIIEGLKEGESILVKPDNTVKEGMKVVPGYK
ncbi:MAG: efflux RND transporter periplasmic adaptor subunit [Deltaproteobacteria bacterium]